MSPKTLHLLFVLREWRDLGPWKYAGIFGLTITMRNNCSFIKYVNYMEGSIGNLCLGVCIIRNYATDLDALDIRIGKMGNHFFHIFVLNFRIFSGLYMVVCITHFSECERIISVIVVIFAGEIVLYNIFYEIFTVCTSIIAQAPDGKFKIILG